MSIHIEAVKHGLFILHASESGPDHYAIAGKNENGVAVVYGVSDACSSAQEAIRQALDRAIKELEC